MFFRIALLSLTLFVFPLTGFAANSDVANDLFKSTNLPVPRYVSIKGNKTYARTGPSTKYPIKAVYKRKDLPVEIVQEFDTWRKVKDFEGEESWIHGALLSGERWTIIKADEMVFLYNDNDVEGRKIARLEPRVLAKLEDCDYYLCKVSVGSYSGWVERNFLWGIYEDEKFN